MKFISVFKQTLLLFLLFFTVSVYSQGLKGVELGDYGLTSPLYGKKEINTTVMGCVGVLTVKKYNNKIFNIRFVVYDSPTEFSKTVADELAKGLINKYHNIEIEKLYNGNWVDKNEWDEGIGVFIQPKCYGKDNTGKSILLSEGVIEITDNIAQKRYLEEEEKKEKSDF